MKGWHRIEDDLRLVHDELLDEHIPQWEFAAHVAERVRLDKPLRDSAKMDEFDREP